MAVKKVGLLGGSFDPVHKTHIELAASALSELGLDEVQLLPAADPWQRTPLIATPQQRLDMLTLATAGRPGLSVNPSEVRRGGKTYTIETIESLPENTAYYWILGSDQLSNFCTWHRWTDIARKVTLVVARRPGSSAQLPPKLARTLRRQQRHVIELPFAPSRISASSIRERLAHGLPVDDMLDEAVYHYIKSKGLYQGAQHIAAPNNGGAAQP